MSPTSCQTAPPRGRRISIARRASPVNARNRPSGLEPHADTGVVAMCALRAGAERPAGLFLRPRARPRAVGRNAAAAFSGNGGALAAAAGRGAASHLADAGDARRALRALGIRVARARLSNAQRGRMVRASPSRGSVHDGAVAQSGASSTRPSRRIRCDSASTVGRIASPNVACARSTARQLRSASFDNPSISR